ncbi:MAG TPA: ABC transporter permease [Kofleriaceae bacterium]|jgi:ABC-2 type transport system permease protein|nr:ABC transporter permease [Kofleriaceae bacterium]
MRATSIIYKRELGRYLRSPIGWIIAALMLLIAGILFQSQALPGDNLSAIVLEKFFYFATAIPMFCGVLLAFRLIAEERQNYSMILLKTSPIRDTEIVLGKFFAALTFLAIILALSIYMPLLIKVNGKITGAQIFIGYFGLFLFGAAVLSIGIFASALTSNQIVAALLGAVFVAVMMLLFVLAKRLDAPVQDVLEQVDLWWIHYQGGFMRGVLNLKDVIYYLGVTYFFLLLAVKTLEAKRWQ